MAGISPGMISAHTDATRLSVAQNQRNKDQLQVAAGDAGDALGGMSRQGELQRQSEMALVNVGVDPEKAKTIAKGDPRIIYETIRDQVEAQRQKAQFAQQDKLAGFGPDGYDAQKDPSVLGGIALAEGTAPFKPQPRAPKTTQQIEEEAAARARGTAAGTPPKPVKPVETPEQRAARIEAEAAARARGTAAGTPTKPQETPEQRAARIAADAKARAEGAAAGAPPKAPADPRKEAYERTMGAGQARNELGPAARVEDSMKKLRMRLSPEEVANFDALYGAARSQIPDPAAGPNLVAFVQQMMAKYPDRKMGSGPAQPAPVAAPTEEDTVEEDDVEDLLSELTEEERAEFDASTPEEQEDALNALRGR